MSLFSKRIKAWSYRDDYHDANNIYGMTSEKALKYFNKQFCRLESDFMQTVPGKVRYGYLDGADGCLFEESGRGFVSVGVSVKGISIKEDGTLNKNEGIPDTAFVKDLINMYHETEHVNDLYNMYRKSDKEMAETCMNYIACSYNPGYGDRPECYNRNFREISCEIFGISSVYMQLQRDFPDKPNEDIVFQTVREKWDEQGSSYFLAQVLEQHPADLDILLKSGMDYAKLFQKKSPRYRFASLDDDANRFKKLQELYSESDWDKIDSKVRYAKTQADFDRCLTAGMIQLGLEKQDTYACLVKEDLSMKHVFGVKDMPVPGQESPPVQKLDKNDLTKIQKGSRARIYEDVRASVKLAQAYLDLDEEEVPEDGIEFGG